MNSKLKFIVVEHNPSAKKINNAVIWLHGLGASGNDFEPIVPELGLDNDIAVRFIFPHAPERPVTINNGFIMPAWYDILEMSLDRKVDVNQIQQSSNQIVDLIKEQNALGVPTQNIVIAGFSQGGAVAYHTALSYTEELAGLLALSTYLATDEILNYSKENKCISIKIDHGIQDPVVPEVLGRKAKESLINKGYDVSYSHYHMAHQVCMPQIKEIGQWFNRLFNK